MIKENNKYDITERMKMNFVEIMEEVVDDKVENLILMEFDLNEFIRFVVCYVFLLCNRYFKTCVAERAATFLHRQERQIYRIKKENGL